MCSYLQTKEVRPHSKFHRIRIELNAFDDEMISQREHQVFYGDT